MRERAQQRWDALVRGDLQAAYGFLSPGTRTVTSFEDYARTIQRDFWKAAKVKKVACKQAEEVCEVESEISYVFQRMPVTTPFKETWTRAAGQWWFVAN